MFNYYKEGYEQGYADGLDELEKNFERHMPLFPALVSEQVVSTFCNGYNTGYEKGKREKMRHMEKRITPTNKTMDDKGDVEISF